MNEARVEARVHARPAPPDGVYGSVQRRRLVVVPVGAARTAAVLAGLIVVLGHAAPARARRVQTAALQVDPGAGSWIEGRFAYVKQGRVQIGGVVVGGRWHVLDGLGARASAGIAMIRPEGYARVGRAWLGAEPYTGWRLGEARLSIGLLLEIGTPFDGEEPRPSSSWGGADVFRTGWAGRVGGAVALSGAAGFLQLEAVHVRALGDSEDPSAFPFPPASETATFVALGAMRYLDKRRALALDARLDVGELTVTTSLGLWSTFFGNPWRAHTAFGVTVFAGENAFGLGLSVLHLR